MQKTAVIVAKGYSARLPVKNSLPFGGLSLLSHKIQQLLSCEFVDEVVVGTNCDILANDAEKHGAKIVRRDEYHCDESLCSANEMIADMCRKIKTDVVIWAHCTNPLVKPNTYDRAIQEFLKPGNHDSLASVTEVREHFWKNGEPFNFDPWGPRHVLAKNIEPLYKQNGAIFIQHHHNMLSNSYFYGKKPILFPLDEIESVDINTKAEYHYALSLLENGLKF